VKPTSLKGRSLLTLADYSKEEIIYLLDLSDELKARKRRGERGGLLAGKNVALIFEKPSTRTRCAFTVACADEGAHPEYLGVNDIQLGHKESVYDTAKVLGRMFDGIEFRGFRQSVVRELAEYSGVPVFNGLTDEDHPTQALADLMTIRERFGTLAVKLAFVGDGRNNVANALMIAASKVGMDCAVVSPRELWPDVERMERCRAFAAESGASLTVTDDPAEGLSGAGAVYTDVWASMGEESKAAERAALLAPYRVDVKMLSLAAPEAILLHCLPAVKGGEVTAAAFALHEEVIFDQAENRMHTIKAVMAAAMSDAL
jgi:ornithine carbamoyltransferase